MPRFITPRPDRDRLFDRRPAMLRPSSHRYRSPPPPPPRRPHRGSAHRRRRPRIIILKICFLSQRHQMYTFISATPLLRSERRSRSLTSSSSSSSSFSPASSTSSATSTSSSSTSTSTSATRDLFFPSSLPQSLVSTLESFEENGYRRAGIAVNATPPRFSPARLAGGNRALVVFVVARGEPSVLAFLPPFGR